MKYFYLLLSIILCFNLNAQISIKNVFRGNIKTTFLGLDFTQAKFIGENGFNDPVKISEYYLTRWNEIIFEEYKKYSIQKALSLKKYETSTNDMILHNEGYDVSINIQNKFNRLTEEDVKNSVRDYNLSVKEGLGVVYVVESLNKLVEKSVIWITFIDLKTSKVLYTERFDGVANDFGFRNYWLGSIININKKIRTNYGIWKKKFK